MQVLNYKLEAYVKFEEESVEQFLVLCEEAIHHITSDERAQFKLKTAIHELLVNALEHGYKKKSGKVGIAIRRDGNSITFEVSDEGEGLNPSTINLNKAIKSIDEAANRGWGLLITNKLSENMEIHPNQPCGTKITISFTI